MGDKEASDDEKGTEILVKGTVAKRRGRFLFVCPMVRWRGYIFMSIPCGTESERWDIKKECLLLDKCYKNLMYFP